MLLKWAPLVALFALTVRALEPGTPGYSCDPATCNLPDCFCPSTAPPGGLSVEETPQFVLLTFDDAVNVISLPYQKNVTNFSNPNGCPARATFFVSTEYTNYHYLQQLRASGHEIAVHTMTHPANANYSEIMGCMKAINAYSGVPMEDFRGFRAPYLELDMDTFKAIQDAKLTWDSSLSVDPKEGPWPFTYDNGFPYACTTGTCDYSKTFPGLWEIPMYNLVDPATGYAYGTMDPPGTPEFLMELLQHNFRIHWEGTRTPMGLWLHVAWFMQDENADRLALLNDFIAWTRVYTNNQVYYVTGSQLIEYMRNPVSLQDMQTSNIFECPDPTYSTVEVCNGLDDDGNGLVDEGVLNRCNLGSYFTDTCFRCPTERPSPMNPVPEPCPEGQTCSPPPPVWEEWPVPEPEPPVESEEPCRDGESCSPTETSSPEVSTTVSRPEPTVTPPYKDVGLEQEEDDVSNDSTRLGSTPSLPIAMTVLAAVCALLLV